MARSSLSTDAVSAMLRDLKAAETLTASLEATAPVTVAEAGGAQALIAKHGHRTGAWFWSVASLPEALWARMADEHQASHRANVGDVDE